MSIIDQNIMRGRYGRKNARSQEELANLGISPRLTKKVLFISQTLEALDCAKGTLTGWIKAGKFPVGEKINGDFVGKKTFWTKEQIDAFKESATYQAWLKRRKPAKEASDRKPLKKQSKYYNDMLFKTLNQ